MGIDPGTNFMGYAILKTTGKNCKPELIVSGVVDMKKMSDPYPVSYTHLTLPTK